MSGSTGHRDAPAAGARVEFGSGFTRHMLTGSWRAATGWVLAAPRLREPLPMDPAMVGLHYGQVAFEGLKAYRQPDGVVASFRPAEHASRFQRSAERLAVPPLPTPVFLAAVDGLLLVDGDELPADPSMSLYLRPVVYGSEPRLALRPATEYEFVVVACVTGGIFTERPEPVSVWVSRDQVRAFPGGTGDVKVAGNYAPTYPVQATAAEHGCQQVIWLDALERRWVEERGGMNVFFVRGRESSAQVVTPPSTGTLLPGITRASLLRLAEDLGYEVVEEPVSVDGWRAACAADEITESFACGTAASVTPIGTVRDGDDSWTVGDGRPGPVTLALRAALVNRQRGLVPDSHGWLRRPQAS